MKSADCSASSGGLDDTLYVVVKKKKTTLCCVIAHQWRSSSQSSSSRKLKRKRSTLGPNFEQHHLSPPLESKKRGVHYLFNYLVKWPIFWKGIICVAFTYYCCWKKWLFWANCQKPRLVNDLFGKQIAAFVDVLFWICWCMQRQQPKLWGLIRSASCLWITGLSSTNKHLWCCFLQPN